MSPAYESLAHNLRIHREKLHHLHPELRTFLEQTRKPQWTERQTPGWSRKELATLSHFLPRQAFFFECKRTRGSLETLVGDGDDTGGSMPNLANIAFFATA